MSDYHTDYPSDLKSDCTLKIIPCVKLHLRLPSKPPRALCTPEMRLHFARLKIKAMRRKFKSNKRKDQTIGKDEREKCDDHVQDSPKKLMQSNKQKSLAIADQNIEISKEKLAQLRQEREQRPESDNTLEPKPLEGDGKRNPDYDALRAEGYESESDNTLELIPLEGDGKGGPDYDALAEAWRAEGYESESDDTLEPSTLEGDGKRAPDYDALTEALRAEGYVDSSSDSEPSRQKSLAIADQNIEISKEKMAQLRQESEQRPESDNKLEPIPLEGDGKRNPDYDALRAEGYESERDNTIEPIPLEGDGKRGPDYNALAEAWRAEGYVDSSSDSEPSRQKSLAIADQNIEISKEKMAQLRQESEQRPESDNTLEPIPLEGDGKGDPDHDALRAEGYESERDNTLELIPLEGDGKGGPDYDALAEAWRAEGYESASDDTLEPSTLEGDGKRAPVYDALAEALRAEGYVDSSSDSEPSRDLPHDETSDNEDNDLEESDADLRIDLVCEVLYAFIGFDGKYLRLVPETNHFRMISACQRRLERGQVCLVLRFANLGFYYKTLYAYSKTTSTLTACGNCGRALASALNDELRDYIDFVHLLHAQFDEQKRHGSVTMTLLQLARWHCETESVFKWLCLLLAECLACVARGVHILCALKRFVWNGNQVLNRLAKRLLCAASEPLYKITARWLTYGDVQDPYQDFFVIDTAAAHHRSDEQAYSATRYTLCLARLPPFLDRKMAEMIVAVGKCNKFEQLVLKECDRFAVGMNSAVTRLRDAANRLSCQNDDSHLQDGINYFCCVFGHVLKRCLQELNFMAHLRILHKFVLLSDTNFVRIFIAKLALQFDDNAKNFYTFNVNRRLKSAWRRSHEPWDDEHMLEALFVEQLEPLDGNMVTGWDTLTIEYRFVGAVSVLLTPSFPAYRALFKPIWQLHRITFVLYDRIWGVQQEIRRHIRLPHELVQTLGLQMHGLIHRMSHVIGCLRFYHFTDVIQAAWLQLCARVKVAASIDELLAAHEVYLADIKHGFFQTNETLSFYATLKKMYDCIYNLHGWQQRFLHACLSAMELACSIGGLHAAEQSFQTKCELLRTELDAIVKLFEKSMIFFLLALRRSGDAKFMTLFDALDYNRYYRSRNDQIQQVASFKYWRKCST